MAVASLDVTKTYADGASLTEAKLDSSFQSIENYTQNSLVNNFNQLRKDIFGTAYDYDNDGNANLTNSLYKDCFGVTWTANTPKTNSLYNKQSASITHNSSIILSNNDVNSWTLVSATLNLRLVPEATGKYFLSYLFSNLVNIRPSADCLQKFAIFNKTANATLCTVQNRYENTSGSASRQNTTPIYLNYIHNFSSTAAATFSLYYKLSNGVASPASNTLVSSSDQRISMYGQIHKI